MPAISMNVELPDEYYDLRDSVERLLVDHAGVHVLREHWDGEPAKPGMLWRRLAKLGLGALMAPEAHGGDELPLLAAEPLLEALGVHAVPQPIAETVAIAAPALAAELDDGATLGWYEDVVAGRRMATVQLGWDGHAPWAADAGLALVVDGDDVVVCEPGPDTVLRLRGVDPSRRPGRILPPAERGRLRAADAAAVVRRRSLLVAAATLIGLADAVIRRGVDYAQQRRQFDRPIGSFQAVKHMLADAYVQWEFSRRYAWFAAWCDEHDPERALEAAVRAKALAGEAATRASYVGLQVHGGVGYTWESDLHLWLKRIQVLDAHMGSSDVQWRWLVRHASAGAPRLGTAR